MTTILTRKERLLKEDLQTRQSLESTLSTLTSQNTHLNTSISTLHSRISQLETALSAERAARDRADTEYAVLRTQVNLSSEKSRVDLGALRAGIATLRQQRKEDARTIQIMAGELDSLRVGITREHDMARETAEEMARIREKQKVEFERAIRGLKREVEGLSAKDEEVGGRTEGALAELRALNGKIRAVDPDLR